MKKAFLISLLCFSNYCAQAQYTEIINSKRPGFSESPYSVGTGVYQVEAGFFYKEINKPVTYSTSQSIGTHLFLRTGQFFERLEINLALSFQQDEHTFYNLFKSNYKESGLSRFTLGGKYLIFKQEYADRSKEIRSWKRKYAFDWKRMVPSVGVYLGVNTNLLGDGFKEEGVTPKVALLLQNDFTDKLVLITNIIGDKITGDHPEYGYIATITYAASDRISMFAENQGVFIKERQNEFHLGAGIAYLASPNLQFDTSIRTNLERGYTYMYAAVGCSWRLDLHKDSFKTTAKENRPKRIKKRGGFFSRLFKRN
ncbi:MAG: transporter [Flavobacteriaceae bacterium]|nr:transporter [Flavobacteriaceae bacterium]